MFIRRIRGYNAMGKFALGLIILGLLLCWPEMVSAESPELLQAHRQGQDLESKGHYKEAIPFALKALKLGEQEFGPDHNTTSILLNNLAELYRTQGRYGDAEPLYRRSLEIWEKILGPEHRSVATSLNNLALLYNDQGRYGDAEPLFKRSLAIKEKILGPEHLSVATSLNNLASLYKTQGRYGDAESLSKRSLAIKEKILGPEHHSVATSLNNLADLYQTQGRYGDAEPLYKRSLAILEKVLGPQHPDIATILNNLVSLYKTQGRYGDAEPLYKRSLAILEKVLGPEHRSVATSLNNLAGLYRAQGHYDDAEPLYKRSLAILEKVLGPEHRSVATSLNNLAGLYQDQGRYGDAEPFYKRSLAIREKVLGPQHSSVATILNNIAGLYIDQGRYNDAEPLYKRSMAIREKSLGPQHPRMATILNNIASLYLIQGRYVDAEPLLKRSLAIREKVLGSQHPNVAQSLNNLANLFDGQGRYDDAEPLYKRSLAIREKVLGAQHPDVAASLSNLAGLYRAKGHESKGLGFYRRATTIHQDRASRASGHSDGGLSEQKSVRYLFTSHVATAAAVARKEPVRHRALTAEAFSVAQLARATQTGATVSRMAARFAAGNDGLAKTIRGHQDAIALWQKLDADLIKLVSAPPDKRNHSQKKNLRSRLKALDGKIAALAKKLAVEFPDYAEIATPKPLALKNVHQLLGVNEALVAYLVTNKKTYIFAVRRDGAKFYTASINRKTLHDRVSRLRKALDAIGITDISKTPAFDVSAAHELYKDIFAPVEPFLNGAHHVFVVHDGALQSLPLGVLVSSEPRGEYREFAEYRLVSWLTQKYALTTLPSVSSLRALRTFSQRVQAKGPFIGFGDPLLKGHPSATRGIPVSEIYKRSTISGLSVANVNQIRHLGALPETADELRVLALAAGGGEDNLFLRAKATETNVKKLDLSQSRIIAFATHGLIAGQLKNADPALVLTPPKTPSKEDDGLLTASEIAQLKLNANMVILSACNTAANDGSEGAEGFSGLAKAFFYAGTRSLLVSHWPVETEAATKLTTEMMRQLAEDDHPGRSEALRRSMLTLMKDTENPHFAHPLYWAPFVVVGEGGTYAVK
jgi:tetratricopeptide (TPR) repeat protein